VAGNEGGAVMKAKKSTTEWADSLKLLQDGLDAGSTST
jgi:hypothetical protein